MGADRTEMTAYCGLYCVDCSFHIGTVPDLARDLREELERIRFDKVSEVIPFMDAEKYKITYEFLGSLAALRCEGCKVSERSKYCHIAQCAVEKDYAGCWECDIFDTCDKLDFLVPVHGDAHLENLRKIKDVGVDKWVEGGPLWYSSSEEK